MLTRCFQERTTNSSDGSASCDAIQSSFRWWSTQKLEPSLFLLYTSPGTEQDSCGASNPSLWCSVVKGLWLNCGQWALSKRLMSTDPMIDMEPLKKRNGSEYRCSWYHLYTNMAIKVNNRLCLFWLFLASKILLRTASSCLSSRAWELKKSLWRQLLSRNWQVISSFNAYFAIGVFSFEVLAVFKGCRITRTLVS